MNDKIDTELESLIKTLRNINQKVGGDSKEESSINPAYKDDPFLAIKMEVMEQLTDIRTQLSSKSGGDTDIEGVKLRNAVHTALKAVDDKIYQLGELNQTESGKRKSKFSKEELDRRHKIVDALQQEVANLKGSNRPGEDIKPPGSNLVKMEYHDLFKKKEGGGSGGSSNEQTEALTSDQMSKLAMIDRNKAEQDKMLNELGFVVDDLMDKAVKIKSEVELQNVEIEALGDQIDAGLESVQAVNARLKGTLEELDRGEGKCCMDIVCILLMLGMVAFLIKLLEDMDW